MREEKKIELSEEEKKDKEAYAEPNVKVYGKLKDLTQMPGRSVSCEGFSGKTHQQPRPPDDKFDPCRKPK